jgi:hypothetical protein
MAQVSLSTSHAVLGQRLHNHNDSLRLLNQESAIMSINFLYDKHTDRVYLTESASEHDTRQAIIHAESLKGDAARSINTYFHQLQISKQLGIVSIDAFVANAMNLVAVRKYLDDDESLEYVRSVIIKNHISMLLKNYIASRE